MTQMTFTSRSCSETLKNIIRKKHCQRYENKNYDFDILTNAVISHSPIFAFTKVSQAVFLRFISVLLIC